MKNVREDNLRKSEFTQYSIFFEGADSQALRSGIWGLKEIEQQH